MAIKLVVTSTRNGRVGRSVADAIEPLLEEGAGREVEVIDLRDADLPLHAEPMMPKMGVYEYDTTKQWAKTVSAAEAWIFLTPEYNGFFTPAAMNALNTVYAEWGNKPAAIVGYGFGGASRAVPALAQLMANVELNVLDTSVQMAFGDALGEDGLNVSEMIAPHADALRELGRQLAAAIA